MPLVMPMLRGAAVFAVAAMLLAAASMAVAAPVKRTSADRAPFNTDGGDSFSGDADQHGGTDGHLPGSSSNVQRVSKLELTGRFGNVVPGQIADLAVYKDFAYLNSWNEDTCTRGGTYVADIRNPRQPSEVAFIPALPKNFHGEGAHVISVDTKDFSGDLLAVNNETCADTARGGGFDLYDVTDPTNPKTLIQGFGDFGAEGKMTGNDTKSKEYHSVFLWTATATCISSRAMTRSCTTSTSSTSATRGTRSRSPSTTWRRCSRRSSRAPRRMATSS
jgi:hypothetical protein